MPEHCMYCGSQTGCNCREVPIPQPCECRFDGDRPVRLCKLHAMKEAQLAEVEQSRGNWIVECRAYEDKARNLREKLAEAERLLRAVDAGRVLAEVKCVENGKSWVESRAEWLRASDSASAAREHTTSADCWCSPTVDYVDPETGVTVYVHHEPN